MSLFRIALLLLPLVLGATSVSLPADEEPKVAGRDVPAPKRTKFVAPEYPAEAQALGQRGIVILELVIDEQGKVTSVDVVRSVPPFDEAAVSAVRQWEFEVTRADGRPVRVRHTVPISFALKLPEMTCEAGIPELRAGVAPAFPQGLAGQMASVKADVTLDPRGEVVEAAIKKGDSPWAEAVLQAIRTWRFVPSGSDLSLSFWVEVQFVPAGKGAPRVDLKLGGLRRKPMAAEQALPQELAPPAGSPSTALASPEPAPAAGPSPTPPSPAASPSSVPSAEPVSPATLPPVAPPPASAPPSPSRGHERSGAPAAPPATVTRPAVEVVPGGSPATPSQAAVSAIRDISLGPGVPDLTAGRRPVVPPLARLEGVTGTVQVRFAVDAGGVARSAEILGPEPLREAARQTVDSWTFRRTSAERLLLVAVFDYKADTANAAVKLRE